MTNSLPADIAAEVRAEISRQRKPQRKLAEILGISQQQVSDRVLGVVEWRISELVQVARWLNVPLASFVPADAPAGAA
jgi:transcriptional regulator with XRE-family HTH domain